MKRELFTLGFILVLALGLMSGSSLAAETSVVSGTCGENLTWVLDSEGTLTISGTGEMDEYYKAYGRQSPWIEYSSKIKKVKITEGVTSIGDYSFWKCDSMSSIEIPDTVISIGVAAFEKCSSLLTVELPNSVSEIKNSAFLDCENLYSVKLPETLKNMRDYAFYNCSSLKEISIPETVEDVGLYAFYNCTNLKTAIIGGGRIYAGAFSYCENLSSLIFTSKDPHYGQYIVDTVADLKSLTYISGFCGETVRWELSGSYSEGYQLSINGKGDTWDYRSESTRVFLRWSEHIKSAIVESGVDNVGNWLLAKLPNLTEVIVEDGIQSLGTHVFDNCTNLKTVSLGKSVTDIGGGTFEKCAELNRLELGSTSIKEGLFDDCCNLSIASGFIGNNYWAMDFYEDKIYLTVSGDEEVSFSNYRFHWLFQVPCYSEKPVTVEIKEGITEIGRSAFIDCKNLKEVSLPSTVTKISSQAFANCSGLSKITVPESVMDIDTGDVFSNCNGLISAGPIGGGYNYEFGWTDKIPENAFKGCTSINRVVIPTGITEIGKRAFSGCTSLSRIIIPADVVTIGEAAFEGCDNFITAGPINGGYNIEFAWENEVPDYAFSGCQKLSTVIIPEGITRIGDFAFKSCYDLNVVIPNSVTSIGKGIYFGSDLENIFYSGSQEEWRNISTDCKFYGVTIHYNSTGPDTSDPGESNQPQYILAKFTGYDEATKQVSLETDSSVFKYWTTDQTDMSFANDLNALKGKYVLVQYLSGDYATDFSSRYVLSISSAVVAVGKLDAVTETSITINGKEYPMQLSDWANQSYLLQSSIGKFVVGYVLNNQVVEVTWTEEKSGKLEKGAADTATIDGQEYIILGYIPPYLTAPELWYDQEISFQEKDGIIFHMSLAPYNTQYTKKLVNYDPTTQHVTFHDNSLFMVADTLTVDQSLVGQWVTFTLDTTATTGRTVTKIEAIKPVLNVNISMENSENIYLKDNKYSYEGTEPLSSSQFEFGFTGTISSTIPFASISDIEAMRADPSLDLTLESVTVPAPEGFNDDWGKGAIDNLASKVLHAGESCNFDGFVKADTLFFVYGHSVTKTFVCSVKATNGMTAEASTSFTIINQDFEVDPGEDPDEKPGEDSGDTEFTEWEKDLLKEFYKAKDVDVTVTPGEFDLYTYFDDDVVEDIGKTVAVWETALTSDLADKTKDAPPPCLKITASMNQKNDRHRATLVFYRKDYSPGIPSTSLSKISYVMKDNKTGRVCISDGTFSFSAGADFSEFANGVKAYLKKELGNDVLSFFKKVSKDTAVQAVSAFANITGRQYINTVLGVLKDFEHYKGYIDKAQAILQNPIQAEAATLRDFNTITAKHASIHCPVDVFVYNSENQLCGKIEGDTVTYTTHNVFLYVENGQKSIWMNGDYYLKLNATDTGTMDYTITEYESAEETRNVVFEDVPLRKGLSYTAECPEKFDVPAEEYVLTASTGEKIYATSDTNEDRTYAVSVSPNISHGTLTANPTNAAQGDTVTLTATPNSGYRLASLTVTDEAGNPVSLTSTGNGTYTFTMPASAVTASAAFTAIPQQPEDPDTPEQPEQPEDPDTPEQPAEPFTDVDETDWFYDEVVYVYANGLMDGVGGNRFAPDTSTNRAMLATILYRLAGEPDVSGDLPFTDVETGTWYTDAVLWAAQNGIVNGVEEGIFAPMNTLTREQLVTMLYRYAEAEGYDVSAAADLSGYPDAGKVLSYAQKAMSWAVAEGIVAGMDDGTLNPAGNATRAQIATILMRFCESVAQ